MRRIALFTVLFGVFAMTGVAQAGTLDLGQMSPPYASGGGCSGCSYFQIQSSGPSYSAPRAGTITKFRLRIGPTPAASSETVSPIVVRSIGEDHYQVVHRLAGVDLSAQPGSSVAEINASFPVAAGDMIGLEGATTNVAQIWPFDVSASLSGDDIARESGGYDDFFDSGGHLSTRVNLEATLEYPEPAPPVFVDTLAPIITQFKTAYKRWRYKRKGAVVSKRAHPGTTFSLNISEPANVQFTVTKAFRGKITKGVCKKAGRTNRKNRRCTKLIQVHQFSRSAFIGVNRWPYSARYLDAKGKVGTLRPGPYRLTAVAIDAAGNVSAPQTIGFTVVR